MYCTHMLSTGCSLKIGIIIMSELSVLFSKSTACWASKRNTCFIVAGRIESTASEKMEMNKKSSHSKEKPTMGRSSSSSEVKKPAEKDLSSPTFVNQGKQASIEFDRDKPPVC